MNNQLVRGPKSFVWQDVAAIATGTKFRLDQTVENDLVAARAAVERIVASNIRGYGINTGVGAKCNDILDNQSLARLSRNIILSHAVGVGPLLGAEEVRAIMAAAVNNFSHGHSGISPKLVHLLIKLLNAGLTPEVPAKGSVGYLSHMAHIGLVCLGESTVVNAQGKTQEANLALQTIEEKPFVFQAKDGLSFVNGTPCATGLTCLALARLDRLVAWADWVAAMTFENMRGQANVFSREALALRPSKGIEETGRRMAQLLRGSSFLDSKQAFRTQDALSLRSIPQIHGAVRDSLAYSESIANQELASTTDNPAIILKGDSANIYSEAHPVGVSLAICTDHLAIAAAHLALVAERRIDRMVNPLVSGLPAFLAAQGGEESGFMIAQYTALSLVSENRRLAAPASLDGGVTSALQEDYLSHATPSALKLLQIIENCYQVFAIELVIATEAYRCNDQQLKSGRLLEEFKNNLMNLFPPYADNAPLANRFTEARNFLLHNQPTSII